MNDKRVFVSFDPSKGPKNKKKVILEKESNSSLMLMHSQYKDKEIQGHNSPEDYKKWIAIVEILDQRGKVRNAKEILSNLKSKANPSFWSKLFGKAS